MRSDSMASTIPSSNCCLGWSMHPILWHNSCSNGEHTESDTTATRKDDPRIAVLSCSRPRTQLKSISSHVAKVANREMFGTEEPRIHRRAVSSQMDSSRSQRRLNSRATNAADGSRPNRFFSVSCSAFPSRYLVSRIFEFSIPFRRNAPGEFTHTPRRLRSQTCLATHYKSLIH